MVQFLRCPNIVHFKLRWGMGDMGEIGPFYATVGDIGWGMGDRVPNNVQEFLSAAANGKFWYADIPPASGGQFYALMGPSGDFMDGSKILFDEVKPWQMLSLMLIDNDRSSQETIEWGKPDPDSQALPLAGQP